MVSRATLPWHRRFPTKFLSQTSGLRQGEIALFAILEAMMMERGEPVRRDDANFGRRCGMPSASAAARAVDGLLEAGLIRLELDGRLWSDDAEAEMAHRAERSAGGVEAAKGRWGQKDNKNKDTGMPTHTRPEEDNIPLRSAPGKDSEQDKTPLRFAPGGMGVDFDRFWQEWPERYRPERKWKPSKLFCASSSFDRAAMLTAIAPYIKARSLRGDFPFMISFLKGDWREFVDAPPIDNDGDFIITPDRPEWRAWLDDIRLSYGEAGVQSTLRIDGGPRIVRSIRWPAGDDRAKASGGAR